MSSSKTRGVPSGTLDGVTYSDDDAIHRVIQVTNEWAVLILTANFE